MMVNSFKMIRGVAAGPLRAAAILIAVAVVTVSTPAYASVIVDASDNVWVRSDDRDSNRIGDDFMNARSRIDTVDGDDNPTAVTNDVVLLRFDISSLPAAVQSATLNLYWHRNDSTSSRTLSLYGLNDSAPGETTWTEGAVAYETAPGLLNDDPITTQDLDLDNVELLVGPAGYGPQVTHELYTFSGEEIASFLNADENGEVTFLILRDLHTSGNQARFATSRTLVNDVAGTLTPFLDITLVPEPASAALIGLGLIGFGLVRRRRR